MDQIPQRPELPFLEGLFFGEAFDLGPPGLDLVSEGLLLPLQ